MNFIGRKEELNLLQELKNKKTSSLIVVRGRRRIGKSRLIQEFGAQFKHYFEVQGLGPKEATSSQDQLNYFSNEFSLQFNKRQEHFADWTEALDRLAIETSKGEWLILLDEISWLAKGDQLFPEKLKSAWDAKLKRNPKLCLVLCGSISSWIEDEIIMNKAFEGRISLDLSVTELNLKEIDQFWLNKKIKMGSFEKMRVLSVTGGVPKYLEEVLSKTSPDEALMQSCFNPAGFLFHEFDKIFKEIFQRKSNTMEKIVRSLVSGKKTPSEIAHHLKLPLNSDFSENLRILELAGFITKDVSFRFDGTPSKYNYVRLKDNYLRFYLKYIESKKIQIQKGGKVIKNWSDLTNYQSILGYQFENLILSNRTALYPFLNLENKDIITAAPFVQRQTSKIKQGCQIDLLIQTQLDVFFLCEIKCKQRLGMEVIEEVKNKMFALKLPHRSSLKPVLIYEGEINDSAREIFQEFFYKMISFSDLLND